MIIKQTNTFTTRAYTLDKVDIKKALIEYLQEEYSIFMGDSIEVKTSSNGQIKITCIDNLEITEPEEIKK